MKDKLAELADISIHHLTDGIIIKAVDKIDYGRGQLSLIFMNSGKRIQNIVLINKKMRELLR